jgi:hypothetical protein
VGWARARRIGRDRTQASMLRVSGAGVGAGSSVWTDATSIAGMGAGRVSVAGCALGMGLGMRRKQRTDGRRCNTSGVKHALGTANHEHEHHLAFKIT